MPPTPVNYDDFVKQAKLTPKDYQRTGVDWCKKRELQTIPHRGGILADEMGLGKTIVAISLLLANWHDRTLIVLPLVLLHQWQKTIKDTTDYFPPIYHGADKKLYTKERLEEEPIILTTYGEVGSGCSVINDIEWGRIFFDEGHHLRNAGTKQFKHALRLKRDITWIITGTPIQNSRKDFFSLCRLLGIDKSVFTKEENLPELRDTYVLRRTKEQVGILLPRCHQEQLATQWTNTKEKYLSQQLHCQLPFLPSVRNEGWAQNLSEHHFGYLMRARQVCAYPKLIEPVISRLDEDSQIHAKEGIQTHSKMSDVIQKILDRKSNGRSKIIFCQFHGEIDAIGRILRENNLTVHIVDGRTKESQRREYLQGNCDVLILQIQTGCEGLNLQTFSEIYFASPHWNPGVEDQAVARCHRIGQKSEVNVFRFNMTDGTNKTTTIDDYCREKQEGKRLEAKILE